MCVGLGVDFANVFPKFSEHTLSGLNYNILQRF